jgi:hypothetical protein
MPYIAEYTDTYGGESNYSWVRRETVEAPNLRLAFRRAKKALGLSGLRGRVSEYGDMIDFRPYGACTVLFVFWRDGGAE